MDVQLHGKEQLVEQKNAARSPECSPLQRLAFGASGIARCQVMAEHPRLLTAVRSVKTTWRKRENIL